MIYANANLRECLVPILQDTIHNPALPNLIWFRMALWFGEDLDLES